jgi:DNA-binding NtrC family response regulator
MRTDLESEKQSGSHREHAPRIVVVDDEAVILEVMEIVIRSWFKNVTLLKFQEGTSALGEILRTEPDLLVTDMCRHGMDGWTMLPLLAEKNVKYPILVQSGFATEKHVRECAGPNLNVTFLQKPWAAKEFCQELLALVGPSDNPERKVLKEEF